MQSINLEQRAKLKKAYNFFLDVCEDNFIDKNCIKISRSGTDAKLSVLILEIETGFVPATGKNNNDEFVEILDSCSAIDFSDADDDDYFIMTLTIPNVYTKE